jgi:hypothetical protein
MAVTLQITDGTTTINLANNTGFQLLRGYVPQFAQPTGDGSIPPYVVEALPVFINISSDDNLAATMQDFHALQKRAAEYWVDPQQVTPVWFHRKLTAETGTVRSLVKSLDFLGSWLDVAPAIGRGRRGVMAIEHHPYWEATATRDLPYVAPAAGLITAYDYTAAGTSVGAHDFVGDVGARIDRIFIETGNVGRLWMGVRSAAKHPDLASLEPIWEMEDSIDLFNDVAVTTDATASPGGGGNTKIRVTPNVEAWTAWTKVAFNRMSIAAANNDANYSNYLWLLRAQVSAGTWEVRVDFGARDMADADFAQGQSIELTNTSWNIVETDIWNIPIRNLQALTTSDLSDAYDQDNGILLRARRTVGEGTLDIDCALAIPLDEGWCMLSGFDFDAGGTNRLVIATSPKDEWTGIHYYTASNTDHIPVIEHSPGFSLPPGDGRLVIAWAQATASVYTDTILINTADWGKYYERWVSLRGAE